MGERSAVMRGAVVLAWTIGLTSVFVVPFSPPARASSMAQAACVSNVGPSIAPPAHVPSGLDGFHASWYGQSGYPTLCPGDRSTAVVAFYNSGSRGWVRGRPGETAFLGTWDRVRGPDRPSVLGGDGTFGSPATGWPRYDRVAAQPADYVGPNQIAWFQFTIQAPLTPGAYQLYLRPLIEGVTWMEDAGVYWEVTVKAPPPDGTIEVGGASLAVIVGATRRYTAQLSAELIGTCVDLAFVDADKYPGDGSFKGRGTAEFSQRALFNTVPGIASNASFVPCVPIPPNGRMEFTITSVDGNAYVRPVLFRDVDGDCALDLDESGHAVEPAGVGAPTRFIVPLNGMPPD